MSKIFIIIFILTISLSSNAQLTKQVKTVTSFQTDSIQLTKLITALLRWHEKDNIRDFDVTTNNLTDSFYSKVDWTKHKKRVAELQKLNLFSQTFIDKYNQIAIHLDKELKANKIKYIIGDLPPYGNDANEWCNCQDYPTNVWKKLKITSLKINSNEAIFKWTFDKGFTYSVKARLENNSWKIIDLERFQIKNFSW